MAPRNPTPKKPGTSPTPLEPPLPPSTPRIELPGLIRADGPSVRQSDPPLSTTQPSSAALPTIYLHDLVPTAGERETSSSRNPRPAAPIRDYELPPQVQTRLPDANAEGLRVHRGRIYAELQYTTTTTVMVGWDDSIGTYRAKLPQEAQPSGPALDFDSDSHSWRVREPDAPRPSVSLAISGQPATTGNTPVQTHSSQAAQPSQTSPGSNVAYVDLQHYVWNKAVTHHHGYTIMHRIRGRSSAVGPELLHAFKDDNGSFVRVEPSATHVDQPADLLPGWTDHDIWDLYGLQGADITRFRTEAHNLGKRPSWARVRTQRQQKVYLDAELNRWQSWGLERERSGRPLNRQDTTSAEDAGERTHVPLQGETPDSPTHSPHLETVDTSGTTDVVPYGHQTYYTWDHGQTDFHGYVRLQRKPGLSDRHGPQTQAAFYDGTTLKIVTPARYTANNKIFRPYWRDIDIWNLYRIEGNDIVRFRRDVAIKGIAPDWVKPREYPSLREQLIDYLRLWTNPHSPLQTQEQVIARFQPYNLSIEQLTRLSQEISPTGQFNNLIGDEVPTWVKSHQARTLVVTRFEQFEPYLSEIHAEIIRLRRQGGGSSLLQASLTPPFFRQLLERCGYKRNKHNYLYRDDFPAVFKVDERTPFEFARAGAMTPQPLSVEGSTSATAVSALFSLKTAMGFIGQFNTMPAASSARPRESLTRQEPTRINDVASSPHSPRLLFCYLIDTRNVEVVPGSDNRIYNAARVNLRSADDSTSFPTMKLEGHVSMQPAGFSSRRIWLVNSAMTRAATVDDLYTQARARSQDMAVEVLNRDEYDALIDEVATAGKRVMEWPPGNDIFSTDITFPVETITL